MKDDFKLDNKKENKPENLCFNVSNLSKVTSFVDECNISNSGEINQTVRSCVEENHPEKRPTSKVLARCAVCRKPCAFELSKKYFHSPLLQCCKICIFPTYIYGVVCFKFSFGFTVSQNF